MNCRNKWSLEFTKSALNAAERYSAYSNIEYIKMLMVYSSKKGITMWDPGAHGMHHTQFATKGEMRERIAVLNDVYDGKPSYSASASASASAAAADY
jgi:hypothetical protein